MRQGMRNLQIELHEGKREFFSTRGRRGRGATHGFGGGLKVFDFFFRDSGSFFCQRAVRWRYQQPCKADRSALNN